MHRKKLDALRFDRRLAHRRGWIGPDALKRALDELPDVSEKVAPSEESEGADESSAGAPAAQAGGETPAR